MMSQTAKRLLLIEDDVALAELIANFLSLNGFNVAIALTAEQARKNVVKQAYDIIVCDIMLPDGNGLHLIKELFQSQRCPVIFLTALGDDESHIQGLDSGAADYIAKPVSPSVLLARIKASMRKIKPKNKDDILQFGVFTFDSRIKALHKSGEKIALTNQEFDILWLFLNSLGKPIAREYLFERIVGREYDGSDRAADLKISRLRKKLQQLGLSELSIESIRNQGYIFTFTD